MASLKAFLLGIYEFRRNITTGFEDLTILEAYEWGRELAHRFTFRRYDA